MANFGQCLHSDAGMHDDGHFVDHLARARGNRRAQDFFCAVFDLDFDETRV
jgi:hypothetical protein